NASRRRASRGPAGPGRSTAGGLESVLGGDRRSAVTGGAKPALIYKQWARVKSILSQVVSSFESAWPDAWMSPEVEALAGCVLLVLSGWWWFVPHGAIWDAAKTFSRQSPLCSVRGWSIERGTERRRSTGKTRPPSRPFSRTSLLSSTTAPI